MLSFTTAAHVQPISPFTILEFAEQTDPAVIYPRRRTFHADASIPADGDV